MKTTIILISILAFPIVGFSQHTLSASGGEAVWSGGTSSYTYGQVFYQTESTSTSSLSQGVQQPFEISIISSLADIGSKIHLEYYPNPVIDYLNLNVHGMEVLGLRYELFDASGRLVGFGNLENSETLINLDYLSSAIYQFKITNSEQGLKTFKLIKK